MDEAGAAALRERGWARPLIALGAVALLPVMPPWLIPWLRIVMPIEHAMILLIPAIAVCALVALLGRGRAWLAFLWIGIAAWMVGSILLGRGASPFERAAAGWGLMLAASFGLCCILMPKVPFLPRAIAAVAAAAVVGLGLSLSGRGPSPEPFGRMLREELAVRSNQSVVSLQRFIDSSASMVDLKQQSAELRRAPVVLESSLGWLSDRAVGVYPALLALEGLAVLALAWALFHRLSRARIGAPLARLRDFKFNDQLVWGLLLGGAIIAAPTLEAWRAPGWNLVLFFGGLYALRGLAVLVWYLAPLNQILMVLLIGVILAIPKYGLALTFGVGLGDTWLNLRARLKPAT